MGARFRYFAVLAVLPATAAFSQDLVLPPIDVTVSRTGAGITGASTSVVTAEDIARSPSQSLPDILAQQAGVQVQHLLGAPNGSRDTVDMRGFGAFAQSNVLVLVNGRRYQDNDLQGFDFSLIPLNSIERVEITRGNSGTVLYGDGAVGGVINIVTKSGASAPLMGSVEGGVGSYGYQEGRVTVSGSSGPWSANLSANTIGSSGYRQNSKLAQTNVIGAFNYKGVGWSAYLNVAGDQQRQDFSGALPNYSAFFPYTLANPQSTNTPRDFATRQDINVTTGGTVSLNANADLVIDGGIRRKFQQSTFYNYFNPPFFTFDEASAVPSSYINTGMTTLSFTPRIDATHRLFGLGNKLLTGIDVYDTQYDSDRYQAPAGQAIHHYNIRQTTVGFYGMNTTAVRPDTDVSFGGRLQYSNVRASDAYNAAVDPNAGFYGSNPQAPDYGQTQWNYAAHAGIEHRLNPVVTLFARAGRAFRLPNADERVGAGAPFSLTAPATFDLKTQTSWDIEDGIKLSLGKLNVDSSVYYMSLENEIHYIPALQQNINLDPTQRLGWETSARYQLTDDVRLRAGVAYTRATFRDGQNAGNDVPLVSRWSGNVGASWDIVRKLLVLDVNTRFWSSRRMDNDQAGIQPVIPANATVDVKLSGAYDRFFWSAAVLNLFNVEYYDYAIASGGSPATLFGPATPPTIGLFNGYPQPGRTFALRAGVTF